MKRSLLTGSGVLAVVLAVWWARSGTYPLPENAIVLSSPTGATLLDRAHRADHRSLASALQTQETGSWCGVASAVTVLGAAGQKLDQSGFFSPAVLEIRGYWRTRFTGMTLTSLAHQLTAHGVLATAHHAQDEADFRAALARNLQTEGDWMIVNYDRSALGQRGGGHHSPVSAWDPTSDRVLLLDTASYRYPPHWIEVSALFRAMHTVDSESGRTRGWVEIQRYSSVTEPGTGGEER